MRLAQAGVPLGSITRVFLHSDHVLQLPDLLLTDPEMIRTRPDRPSAATIDAIIAHHTTAEQAGTVFRRVAPRLAVYSHAPNTARVLAQTRTTYTGPLQGAEDLLTIRIGTEIRVEHHAPPQPPAPGSPPATR